MSRDELVSGWISLEEPDGIGPVAGFTLRAVDNRSPSLLFAITTDGRRSSYWRMRAGVEEAELFLERENFTKQWHLSLHTSGHWHLKNHCREVLSWSRPAEQIPGYTRALGIVLPVDVVHREDAPPPDVKLVKVSADSESYSKPF